MAAKKEQASGLMSALEELKRPSMAAKKEQASVLFCIMPFSTFALHMDSIVDCAQAHCVKKD